MDVRIEAFAKRLLDDIYDLLGPFIRDILAELLQDILLTFTKSPEEFDSLWPTLDMDDIRWTANIDFACIHCSDKSAIGGLWRVELDEWLRKERANATKACLMANIEQNTVAAAQPQRPVVHLETPVYGTRSAKRGGGASIQEEGDEFYRPAKRSRR